MDFISLRQEGDSMEDYYIYIKPRPRIRRIKRDAKGGGVIRINKEACSVLDRVLEQVECDISVSELASKFILFAMEHGIVKESSEMEED